MFFCELSPIMRLWWIDYKDFRPLWGGLLSIILKFLFHSFSKQWKSWLSNNRFWSHWDLFLYDKKATGNSWWLYTCPGSEILFPLRCGFIFSFSLPSSELSSFFDCRWISFHQKHPFTNSAFLSFDFGEVGNRSSFQGRTKYHRTPVLTRNRRRQIFIFHQD